MVLNREVPILTLPIFLCILVDSKINQFNSPLDRNRGIKKLIKEVLLRERERESEFIARSQLMELAGLTAAAGQGHQQQQPQRSCPRCNSNNTKFCYYNNYSLTQPRYFCKGCRRYWTHGGTLRNVPVGGSSRKSKRPRSSSSAQPPPADANSVPSASTSSSAQPLMAPNLGVGGGGFLSSLVLSQSMSLQPQVLQGRHDFAPFGWNQSFIGAGGDGNVQTAATGAQFWTLGGATGSGGGEEGCGSIPNQWRNFPAVTRDGDDDI